MQDNKHTSGPWAAEHSEANGITWVRGADGTDVCDLYHRQGRNCFPKPNAAANARLIAAAPDLLEALEQAESLISGELVGSEWKRACHAFLRKARTAIAKAKGE